MLRKLGATTKNKTASVVEEEPILKLRVEHQILTALIAALVNTPLAQETAPKVTAVTAQLATAETVHPAAQI